MASILLVEDEPHVRKVVARELGSRFEVIEAADAREALGHIGNHPDLAAVVTDLDLGTGATGIEVLWAARRRAPRAARILVSGRTSPAQVSRHLAAGVVGTFVQKPWRFGTLLEAVSAAVASARESGNLLV